MAFVFKPGLWRASSTSPPSVGEVVGSGRMFWLPAPIYNFPVSVEWKGRIVETRLADGAEGVRGNKKKARTESFSGKIAKTTRDGTVLYTDEAMYEWVVSMLPPIPIKSFLVANVLTVSLHANSPPPKLSKSLLVAKVLIVSLHANSPPPISCHALPFQK